MTNNNQSEEVENIVVNVQQHSLRMKSKFLEEKNWVEYIIRTTITEIGASEYARGKREALKQILCRHDIDGDVCDCCRTNHERIDDLI